MKTWCKHIVAPCSGDYWIPNPYAETAWMVTARIWMHPSWNYCPICGTKRPTKTKGKSK